MALARGMAEKPSGSHSWAPYGANGADSSSLQKTARATAVVG